MMRSPMTLREALFADYGPIMDSKAICKVLHYPSTNALHAAKGRGSLPFEPLVFENRRGIFALTEDIAATIDRAAQRPDDRTALTRGTCPPTGPKAALGAPKEQS